MPFRSLRPLLRRWAAALALLALLAQMLAHQASAGHMAAMLSERWLAGDICTGMFPGTDGRVPLALDFGDKNAGDDSRPPPAQCPLCAIAMLPLLQPQRLAVAPLAPLAVRTSAPPAVPAQPFETPRYLQPPAHGPPAAA